MGTPSEARERGSRSKGMTPLIIRRHCQTNIPSIRKKEVFRSGQTKSLEKTDSTRSSASNKTGQKRAANNSQPSSKKYIAPDSPPPSPYPQKRRQNITSHRSRRPSRQSAAGLVENQGGRRTRWDEAEVRGDGAPYLDYCVRVRERLESGVLLCYDDAGIYYCLMNLLITLMIEYNSTQITMMS